MGPRRSIRSAAQPASSSWWRQPWLHFLLLGTALYLASLFDPRDEARSISAPSPAELERLVESWRMQTGREPGPELRERIAARERDERILLAEALRLGLHQGDPLVRERLLKDADFLGIRGDEQVRLQAVLDFGLAREDEVVRRRLLQQVLREGAGDLGDPTEAQLQSWYQRTAERWQQPAAWRLRQLTFTQGDATQRARQALGQGEEERLAMADAILHPHELPLLNARRLQAMFGMDFVAALPREAQAGWFGPVPSRYGQHLLQIMAFEPARALTLDQVRESVKRLWRDATQREREQAYLDGLRALYEVRD